MLTAKEAREQSMSKYQKEVQDELNDIEEQILVAIDKCNTSITIYHNIHAETANHLRELGYTVEQDNYRNEVDITISW